MYFQHSRPEMKEFLPSEYKNVLEIGCGEGIFRSNLTSDINELWGIEPSNDAARKAEMNGYKVLHGNFGDVFHDLPNNHFDLIVCNDVIEHMIDHDKFFHQIKEKMSGNASIIGSIPNIRYYKTLRSLIFGRDWRYTDAGILDYTHLRFFTEKSLKRTLESHDYQIKMFKGINKVRNFKIFIFAMMIATLGSWGDIRYPQFAFRIQTID